MATASAFQFITTLTTLIDDKATEENDDSHNYGSGMGDHYADEYGMYGNSSHYGTYDYYAEGDLIPYFYKVSAKWEIVFRGYISFLITFVVIVTNALMLSVFMRRIIRTQTTVVLVALAISDALICFTILPEAFYFNYFNIVGNHEEYVPYRLVSGKSCAVYNLPDISNNL